MLALVFERPGLCVTMTIALVQNQAIIGIDSVEQNMHVPVLSVVMGDDHRLVLVPTHRFQELIGCRSLLLGCRLIGSGPAQHNGQHYCVAGDASTGPQLRFAVA
jgi:hypothetical protein